MTWAFVVVGLVFAAVIFVRQIKREGPPQYAPATAGQKLVSAALLAALLAAWGVVFMGWDVFGGYERHVALVVQLVAVVSFVRLTAILKRA
jgi:hypothetical protein